jgi:hypothetical protein
MVADFSDIKGTPGGELAVADQFQRNLQKIANKAMRDGNATVAEEYGLLAEKVRNTMENLTGGPEYTAAREAAQAGKFEKEAIEGQHKLANKVFKETKQGIPRAVTKEMPNWAAEAAAALPAAGILSYLFGPAGLAVGGTGLLASNLVRRHKFSKDVKMAPSIAKYLAGREVPAMPKMSTSDKALIARLTAQGGLVEKLRNTGAR